MDTPPIQPPAAPPTQQGTVPTAARGPTNTAAVVSISCGFVGLVVPLVNVVALWVGIRALRQIRREPAQQGKGFAVVGVVTGALGIIFTAALGLAAWGLVFGVKQVVSMMDLAPEMIHQRAGEFAKDRGRYPKHVAELMLSDDTSWLIPMWAVKGKWSNQRDVLMVGDHDLANYDLTSPAPTSQLRTAIEKWQSDEPYYQFGDCWFVRLDRPTNNEAIIAAWSLDRKGEVAVVYDSGLDFRPISPEQWETIWRTDGTARKLLELPAIEPPPYPSRE